MPKASKTKAEILEYTREGLLAFLKKLPTEQISQGFWKVYQDRAGRGGLGTIQASVGRAEFEPDADLEQIVQEQFLETYGGGSYTFRLHDSHRARVKEMPDLRVYLAGEPIAKTKPSDGDGSDVMAEQLKNTRSQGQLMQATFANKMLEKQMDKLNGDTSDPLKGAMADLIRSNIKEKKNGNGHGDTKELMELLILSKAIAEPATPKENGSSKAVETIMSAVSGLVTAQASMNQGNMSQMNQAMQFQMTMMQNMGSLGQEDPYIVLLKQAPDLIDRITGGVIHSIREYRGAAMENAAAGAGLGFEQAGAGQPGGNGNTYPPANGHQTPGPGGHAPQPQQQNQFLIVVYQNFKRGVPPEVCADQVQYYLTEPQLRGVLSLEMAECMKLLEKEGLGLAFQRDPQLKEYVYKVIEEVKRIYENQVSKETATETDKSGGEGDQK